MDVVKFLRSPNVVTRAEERKEGGSMKSKAGLWILVFLFLLGGPGFSEEANGKITGDEWLKLFRQEKTAYVLSLIKVYKAKGVSFKQSLDSYIYGMDTAVAVNPQLETETMENIFASVIYQVEPETAIAMEKMKR